MSENFIGHASPTLEAIVVRTIFMAAGVLALVAVAIGFGTYALLT